MQQSSDIDMEKRFSDSATAGDTARTLAWLSTDEGSRLLLEQIDKDLHYLERLPCDLFVPHPIPSDEMLDEILQRTANKRKKSRVLHLWRAAAIFIPLVLLTSFGLYVNRYTDIFGISETQVIEAKRGEKLHFIFQDGSRVAVNSATRLQFPTRFGLKKRSVQLQGEAYFDVAGMKNRPFVIELENAEVKVLGTSFNVNAYPEEDSIRITLDEGSIAFHNNLDHSRTLLIPGQTLVFNKQTGASRLYAQPNATTWTSNQIVFQNTPFREIARVLERTYDVTFHVQNPNAYQFAFTFTSNPNEPLENILKDFERVSSLKFNIKKDTVMVGVE
jgi:ferric-dicitrate binding protein FerR (iron transport regulator)